MAAHDNFYIQVINNGSDLYNVTVNRGGTFGGGGTALPLPTSDPGTAGWVGGTTTTMAGAAGYMGLKAILNEIALNGK